jgi:nucleoid-associated protein YgaU
MQDKEENEKIRPSQRLPSMKQWHDICQDVKDLRVKLAYVERKPAPFGVTALQVTQIMPLRKGAERLRVALFDYVQILAKAEADARARAPQQAPAQRGPLPLST